MFRKRDSAAITLCLAATMLLSGCAAKTKAEALVPASGVVKLNGRPADGVKLIFHPTENTKALGGCWAKTDEQGKYTVTHLSNKPGIPVGTYFVTFSRYVRPDGTPLKDNESPTTTPCSESIGSRWSDISKAGLQNKVVIPDKGSTSLDFNISTAAKK